MSCIITLGPRWAGWFFYRLAMHRFTGGRHWGSVWHKPRSPAGHWTPVPSTSRGLYQVIDTAEPFGPLPLSTGDILGYTTEAAEVPGPFSWHELRPFHYWAEEAPNFRPADTNPRN